MADTETSQAYAPSPLPSNCRFVPSLGCTSDAADTLIVSRSVSTYNGYRATGQEATMPRDRLFFWRQSFVDDKTFAQTQHLVHRVAELPVELHDRLV